MTSTTPQSSSTSDPEYLIHFAQAHETFRKAEIDALSCLHRIPITWQFYSDSSPYAVLHLPSDDAAILLISRSILGRSIHRLWGQGTTYAALHASVKSHLPILGPPCANKTFKFRVESFHGSRSMPDQRTLIETFGYLNTHLTGKIRMKSPDLFFSILEEYDGPGEALNDADREGSPIIKCYLGLLLAESSRDVVDRYDLKKRPYIGTTSMDAELALITANMALASAGKLFYDPFCGTGSFAVAVAHFGAVAMGSDIDGRQIRGTGKRRSVEGNFRHYGIASWWLDGFVADLTNTPLRSGVRVDGIVCDPPYGVREGLKVLGSRDPDGSKEVVVQDGKIMHLQPNYIPPKRPYSFLAMLDDILQFAVDYLVPEGRLCFWMPTANEDENALDIPAHPQLRLLAVSTQEFNKWSRRLLTYERRVGDEGLAEAADWKAEKWAKEKKWTADQCNDFRKRYFEGFR